MKISHIAGYGWSRLLNKNIIDGRARILPDTKRQFKYCLMKILYLASQHVGHAGPTYFQTLTAFHWQSVPDNRIFIYHWWTVGSSLFKGISHIQNLIVQELCESRGGRPGLSVLTSLPVSVDIKLHWTVLRRWSQLVPNMSTDIWGH